MILKGIYKIENLVNNKYYIGSSNNINKRYREHFNKLKNNTHTNKYLQASFNKHGILSFKFEIIEICNHLNKYELLKKEQYYIDKENKKFLYNLSFVTNGGGSDVLSICVYLLNLKGEVLKKYPSISELSRNINVKLLSNNINTNQIVKKQYRIVSEDYYNNNIELILSWNSYSNKITELRRIKELKNILIFEDKEFKNISELAKYLNVTRERVRQILKVSKSKKWDIKYKYPEYNK